MCSTCPFIKFKLYLLFIILFNIQKKKKKDKKKHKHKHKHKHNKDKDRDKDKDKDKEKNNKDNKKDPNISRLLIAEETHETLSSVETSSNSNQTFQDLTSTI